MFRLLYKMNTRSEKERIKIQKQLYKENKLIREQKEKESNTTVVINVQKSKKQLSQFSSISSEKLYDNSTIDDVSLTDMLGIKANDPILSNIENSKCVNEQEKIENDRHYAPDFI